jgi:hypothetical protein
MARVASGINYTDELLTIRGAYVSATPKQRLSIIRQRLEDHHFGPNRLVTVVSAVEALARSLAMSYYAASKADMKKLYANYRNRSPKSLVLEYLKYCGITDPTTFFAEDNWVLFGYAIEYRNMLAHECTYLGLDKFPSLIAACEEVLESLVKLGEISEK